VSFEPLTPERRRAMTRQYLLDAAAIVFARDGFHGATLEEIATTAGFSKGAVYSNFRNKDDLFLALLDDRVDRLYAVTLEVLEAGSEAELLPRVRDLLQAASGPLLGDADTLMTLYLEFVLYARRNPEAREKLVASARRERARIEELIQHQYAVSRLPLPYPVGGLAAFSQALWNGLGLLRLADPETLDDDVIETVVELQFKAM